MTKGFFYDDEDEDDGFEPRIIPRPLGADDEKDEPSASAIAPYAFGTTDAFDTRAYVTSLFKTPLFGAPRYDGTQDHPVPPVDSSRPRSWKLPGTNIAPPAMPGADAALDHSRRPLLGDDTAERIRIPVDAADDSTSGEIVLPPAREPSSPVIHPP